MGLHIWNMSFIVFNCIITMAYSATYIVHMNSSAMPKPYSSPHSWYLATLQSVSDQSAAHISTKKLIYSYTHAIQGFSATLTSSEHDNIKKIPGYLFSTEEKRVQLLTTHSTRFMGLNSDFGAWPNSRYGKDVIIGVVDSGVWPESKSYNDEGIDEIPSRWRGECQADTQFNSSLCNKKLIGARHFNKGYLRSHPKADITMNSTRDIVGHGTHTSSIAAGNFVKGASYFGYGMDVVAAIDQAIIDGVDVLSMSVHSDTKSSIKSHTTPWHKDPIAIASFTATKKGIFVSMTGGNGGSNFPTISNDMPWVLTVAAGTMDRQFSCLITLGNGVFAPGSSLYHDSFTSSQIPMFFMGQCNNISHGAQNKIGVCSSENEPLGSQFLMVQNSKVAAGVFITDKDFKLEFTEYDFPVVFVSLQDGRIVRDYIREEGGQATGKISFHLTRLGIVPAPMVSEFSSRGPSMAFQY
ncbi:subtilisin-like protease [Artemisia annua]|uniref:Subtilisin-like protease n=1 Tax=Artemisia annua TaxID=35608 RepID=A0A2U1L373_ARTAN|nr:subtilisin-like protease [Artemisia annua]